MKLIFSLASFFLFTLFSVATSAQDSLSLRLEALKWEGVYFSSESAPVAESALLSKAKCLLQLGDTLSAEQTLKRISIHLMDSNSRIEADSLMSIVFPMSQSSTNKQINPIWAFIPPVGHILAGETPRGALMTIADIGAVAFAVWQCCSGNWITAYLCSGITLLHTYYNESVRLTMINQK